MYDSDLGEVLTASGLSVGSRQPRAGDRQRGVWIEVSTTSGRERACQSELRTDLALGRSCFSVRTILWNFDSEDWTIGTGAAESAILDAVTAKVMGPKSPGLLPLEHQLSDGAVDGQFSREPVRLWPGQSSL